MPCFFDALVLRDLGIHYQCLFGNFAPFLPQDGRVSQPLFFLCFVLGPAASPAATRCSHRADRGGNSHKWPRELVFIFNGFVVCDGSQKKNKKVRLTRLSFASTPDSDALHARHPCLQQSVPASEQAVPEPASGAREARGAWHSDDQNCEKLILVHKFSNILFFLPCFPSNHRYSIPRILLPWPDPPPAGAMWSRFTSEAARTDITTPWCAYSRSSSPPNWKVGQHGKNKTMCV